MVLGIARARFENPQARGPAFELEARGAQLSRGILLPAEAAILHIDVRSVEIDGSPSGGRERHRRGAGRLQNQSGEPLVADQSVSGLERVLGRGCAQRERHGRRHQHPFSETRGAPRCCGHCCRGQVKRHPPRGRDAAGPRVWLEGCLAGEWPEKERAEDNECRRGGTRWHEGERERLHGILRWGFPTEVMLGQALR